METIKKILTAILKWLGSIPSDKLLHLIAGAVIAAFFALVIPYTAGICVLFAAIAGVAKEAFDQYRYKGWDWLDLAYTMAFGFNIDYLYGRGYYNNQNTAYFNAAVFGSYIGDRYQVQGIYSNNYLKTNENGGITDDRYITGTNSCLAGVVSFSACGMSRLNPRL